ncbi:hypothetical protein PG326_08995 [Riemerella anatipestifer]|nr:hypothetical protein [Riemerella anatipestifer]MDY3358456.1 hypothetical protein [Riemerella anatipestifer]
MEEKTFIFFCKVSKKFKTLLFWMGKSGSFGFLSVGFVCREKPNVPLVRWQKNKKMCVGQKLNLCLVSLSARFFCPFGLGSVVRYHCCQHTNIRNISNQKNILLIS